MTVGNTLQKAPVRDKAISFEVGGQEVKLSPSIVKNYLVSGNGNVTDQEVVMFLNLCKFNRLNPFLREAYLIKYGSSPATMVVGKDAILKRAMRNPRYSGFQAGVYVVRQDGALEERTGALTLPGETLCGGWAKVMVKGFDCPVEAAVSFEEYCQKKDGKATSNWAIRPGTMIRKVALVQALREAFPEDLSDMYAAEEMGMDEQALGHNPVVLSPEPAPAPALPAREPPAAQQPVQPARVEMPVQPPEPPEEEDPFDFFDGE